MESQLDCRLARLRADAVAKLPKGERVKLALAEGIYEEAPVAHDDATKGNTKNRRGEAWLR